MHILRQKNSLKRKKNEITAIVQYSFRIHVDSEKRDCCGRATVLTTTMFAVGAVDGVNENMGFVE